MDDGENVTLAAAGYAWKCPNCGHDHYAAKAAPKVECEHCFQEYAVEQLAHKIGPSTAEALVLQPASYEFGCPQCGAKNYVAAASKTVTCSTCKARMDVVALRHAIDRAGAAPEPNLDELWTGKKVDHSIPQMMKLF